MDRIMPPPTPPVRKTENHFLLRIGIPEKRLGVEVDPLFPNLRIEHGNRPGRNRQNPCGDFSSTPNHSLVSRMFQNRSGKGNRNAPENRADTPQKKNGQNNSMKPHAINLPVF